MSSYSNDSEVVTAFALTGWQRTAAPQRHFGWALKRNDIDAAASALLAPSLLVGLAALAVGALSFVVSFTPAKYSFALAALASIVIRLQWEAQYPVRVSGAGPHPIIYDARLLAASVLPLLYLLLALAQPLIYAAAIQH